MYVRMYLCMYVYMYVLPLYTGSCEEFNEKVTQCDVDELMRREGL